VWVSRARVRAHTPARLPARLRMCVVRKPAEGWTGGRMGYFPNKINNLRRPPPLDGGWTGLDGGGVRTGLTDA